jgi:asparagine synthase (glutamine-hydrolysing)
MCGIAGLVGAGTKTQTVWAMTRALAHRGPDGEGVWSSHDVALGHRRLSIIDIAGGQQPMISASGRWVIVYNGEIYNFLELRNSRYRDYPYRTRSDTETLLAGLEYEGENCLRHFNGMFAFAAWDNEHQRLILARDGQGIKPLYYAEGDGWLAFASEVRALLACGLHACTDVGSLDLFLDLRFVPAPYTIFKGIAKLSPGHYKVVHADGRTEVAVPFAFRAPKIERRMAKRVAKELLIDTLVAAVHRQLISDVPVGILLSGGVDSAAVTAAARRTSAVVSTFCVGYEDKHDANEFDEARRTADLLGTDHHELTIADHDVIAAMPTVIRHLEEPVVTTSMLSYYLLCQAVAKARKVVLTGQGADEPWAGYNRHRIARMLPVLRPVRFLLNKKVLALFFSRDDVLRIWEVLQARTELESWRALHCLFPGDGLRGIRPEAEPHSLRALEVFRTAVSPNGTRFERLLAFEVRASLPENLLMLGDKLSMAHGLEVRVPLLDAEYIKLVEALPARFRMKGISAAGAKYLHKRVCEVLLPKEIVYRRKKGFQTPIDTWMRGRLGSHLDGLIRSPDSFTRRYLSLDAVQQLARAHREGRYGNLERQLFAIWLLEEWYRAFAPESTAQQVGSFSEERPAQQWQ